MHFFHALRSLREIELNFTGDPSIRNPEISHAEEKLANDVEDYFQHVNISSRNNLKLHIRHVPDKFWIPFTEKISYKCDNWFFVCSILCLLLAFQIYIPMPTSR